MDISERKRAEEALRLSEQRRAIVNLATTEGSYEWDITKDTLDVSQRLNEIFGFEPGELASNDWTARLHVDDAEIYRLALVSHFKQETDVLECEYRIHDKSGGERWVSDRAIAQRDEHGRAVRLIGAISDITGRKRAEAELAEKEAQLRLAITHVPGGMVLYDKDLNYVLFNSQYSELHDYPEGFLKVGASMLDELRFQAERGDFGPGNKDELVEQVLVTYHSEKAATWERTFPDGRTLHFNLAPTPEGGYIKIVTEITERKRAEESLRESEQRFALAMTAVNEGVYDWNLVTDEIYYSPRVIATLGFSEAELQTAQDWSERIHPDDLPEYQALLRAHFKGESERFEHEYRYRSKDGSWRWARQHGLALRDETGHAYRMAGSTGDITEEKRLEEALQVARTQRQDVIESISEGLVLFDADDRVVVCNSVYRGYYADAVGPEVADMVRPGALFWDFLRAAHARGMFPNIGPDDFDAYLARRKERRCDPRGTIEQQLSDGRYLQINEHRTADGGIASVYTDVTRRKQVEEELNRQNARLRDEIEAHGRSKATIEYLVDEIKSEYNFEEIIGESDLLKAVLDQLKLVATTDSTVLLLGETGTGKELLVRAIHDLSNRRNSPLVKVNCAALPRELVESELFGHEKGAFTGANEQRKGRFELADKGTIFLDEVGELPPEVQTKLLRVLQEQEFERVGGTEVVRTDARVVAATNVDLAAMVEAGGFRSDLYYRLNVFPLTVPPLRERRSDIPLLAHHFLEHYARKLGKKLDDIAPEFITDLIAYSWPGNVRELQNMIERAAILSPGPLLEAAGPLVQTSVQAVGEDGEPATETSTLQDVERAHIKNVLTGTGWVIAGSDGAAGILGLNPSTLRGRMRKLGIRKPN